MLELAKKNALVHGDAMAALADIERRSQVAAQQLPQIAGVRRFLGWPGFQCRRRSRDCRDERGQRDAGLPGTRSPAVPGAKPWMLGLANVRGSLLPVIDLQVYLGAKARGSVEGVPHPGIASARPGCWPSGAISSGHAPFQSQRPSVQCPDEGRFGCLCLRGIQPRRRGVAGVQYVRFGGRPGISIGRRDEDGSMEQTRYTPECRCSIYCKGKS